MTAKMKPTALSLSQLQELEVVVEKLVAGGDGLARFEGIPIFVPRSAPGDHLRVQLTARHPDYATARILEIRTPGPGRRQPPCPHFSRCGGCDLQHLEDGLQVRLKVEALRETLQRLAGVDWPEAVEIMSDEPWGYRLRTQVHTSREGERTQVGYRARGSHELVVVESCPVLVPALEQKLAKLPGELGEDAPRRLDLSAGDNGALTCAPVVPGQPRGPVSIRVGAYNLSLDARCFFQAHQGLLDRLVEAVVGSEEGGEAYDLYAGVGLFSLPLGQRYKRVVAVEGDRVAARFARKNARQNRVSNVEVVSQVVESWIKTLPHDVARVVVDPPRDGLSRVVRQILCARPPHRLTYVSCHAATLARDIKDLRDRFRLESLAVLDLFPQTGHLETVAQLVRNLP